MEETSLSRRKKLFILLLTLAIHAIIFLILFLAFFADHILDTSKKPTHAYNSPTILAQSPQTHEEASVILYDEPQEKRPLIEPSQGAPKQNAPVVPDAPEVDEPEQPEKPTTIFEQPRNSKIHVDTQEPTVEIPQHTVPQTKPQIKKQVRTQPQSQKAQQMTLSQLTKGFLQSMQQEQGAIPRTTLDAAEMSRNRYGTKVWSILRQSYKAYRAPTHLHNNLTTQAIFVLTIRKDGSLAHAELQHPHKNHDLREVENILTYAAKKAGLFPPIPQNFNLDTITLTFPLGIQLNEGIHTYDLMYG